MVAPYKYTPEHYSINIHHDIFRGNFSCTYLRLNAATQEVHVLKILSLKLYYKFLYSFGGELRNLT